MQNLRQSLFPHAADVNPLVDPALSSSSAAQSAGELVTTSQSCILVHDLGVAYVSALLFYRRLYVLIHLT